MSDCFEIRVTKADGYDGWGEPVIGKLEVRVWDNDEITTAMAEYSVRLSKREAKGLMTGLQRILDGKASLAREDLKIAAGILDGIADTLDILMEESE